MIQRLSENDKIVSRYMDDPDFQNVVFSLLARDIFNNIGSSHGGESKMSQ